jgi:hypothetical protein
MNGYMTLSLVTHDSPMYVLCSRPHYQPWLVRVEQDSARNDAMHTTTTDW